MYQIANFACCRLKLKFLAHPVEIGESCNILKKSRSQSSLFHSVYPSVLWRCWLGGRKGIRPVINMEWWGAGVVLCLERGANDLHMVQLMPLPPHHLLLQQNPEWFILLVPAYPGCPGKRLLKVCVCVFHSVVSWEILASVHAVVAWACALVSLVIKNWDFGYTVYNLAEVAKFYNNSLY